MEKDTKYFKKSTEDTYYENLYKNLKTYLHQNQSIVACSISLKKIFSATLRKEDISLKSSYQSNVCSTKTKARANMKFRINLGWKSDETMDALEKLDGNNALKTNQQLTNEYLVLKGSRMMLKMNLTVTNHVNSRGEKNTAVHAPIEKDFWLTAETIAKTTETSICWNHTNLTEKLNCSSFGCQSCCAGEQQ